MTAVGGMEYATVADSESNTVSPALYRSAGFGALAADRRLRQADRLTG